jgi:hypothetical protein
MATDAPSYSAPPPTSLMIAPIVAPKSEGGCRLTGILVAASKDDGGVFTSDDVQLACVLSCVYGMAVQVTWDVATCGGSTVGVFRVPDSPPSEHAASRRRRRTRSSPSAAVAPTRTFPGRDTSSRAPSLCKTSACSAALHEKVRALCRVMCNVSSRDHLRMWVTYQDEQALLEAISQDAAMLCAGVE